MVHTLVSGLYRGYGVLFASVLVSISAIMTGWSLGS